MTTFSDAFMIRMKGATDCNSVALFFAEDHKQNRRVSARQTPYSFAGPKEYAEKDLLLAEGITYA